MRFSLILLLMVVCISDLYANKEDKIIPFDRYNEAAGAVSSLMAYIAKTDKKCRSHYRNDFTKKVGAVIIWDKQNKRYARATLIWTKFYLAIVKKGYGDKKYNEILNKINRVITTGSDGMMLDLHKRYNNDKVKACHAFESMIIDGLYNISSKHSYYTNLAGMVGFVESNTK